MEKESNLALLAAAGLAGGGYLAYRKYRAHQQKEESKRIPMRDVDSSMIRELGYSPKSRVMHARFNTGRRYRYEDVPLKEYKRLREADSIGTHFNRHFRGKYEHEKLSSLRKEAFGAAIAGGLVGAGVGGLMRDSQGNAGGVGGALTGALVGAASGHLVGKGISGLGNKAKGLVNKSPTTPSIKANTPPAPPTQQPALPPPTQQPALPPPTQQPALPPPTQQLALPAPSPTPSTASGLQGLNNTQLPQTDFSVGAGGLLQVPGAALGGIRDRIGSAVNRFAQKAALSYQLKTAPINISTPTPLPFVKSASYGGISLITDETFEKVAYAPAVTTLAQAGVGAATGALVNKDDRLRGALTGGLIGGVAGAALGRMGGKALAKANLDTTSVARYKMQSEALKRQLKSAQGMTNRQNTIEAFVKNPANKELAGVYRQSMVGGTMGAVGLGAIAAVPQNDPQYKTAAYRAVERLHHVRGY